MVRDHEAEGSNPFSPTPRSETVPRAWTQRSSPFCYPAAQARRVSTMLRAPLLTVNPARKKERAVFCYLIRHGEIQSNIHRVYAGRSGEMLTPNGQSQAKALAGQLAGRGIRILYASPLPRALQTAQILNQRLQVPFAPENDLMEIELGPLEGLSYEQVANRYPEAWKVWNERPGELRLEGMETIASVQQRIIALLKRWCALHAEETIAAVSHLAVIRCVRLFAEQRPLNDYKKLSIPNATALLLQAAQSGANGILRIRVIEEVTGEIQGKEQHPAQRDEA